MINCGDTITNTVTYPLTRALYGNRIRQPIGGDFGVSGDLVRHYLELDDWSEDISKFGIDIWMTTSALTGGFAVCQTRLGAKVHDPKDPGSDLGPMFRQVVGTILRLAVQHARHWLPIRGSHDGTPGAQARYAVWLVAPSFVRRSPRRTSPTWLDPRQRTHARAGAAWRAGGRPGRRHAGSRIGT